MRVMDREEPIDLLIHCGDIEGSESLISKNGQGSPVHMVAGNNDFVFRSAKREGIFRSESTKVLLEYMVIPMAYPWEIRS